MLAFTQLKQAPLGLIQPVPFPSARRATRWRMRTKSPYAFARQEEDHDH